RPSPPRGAFHRRGVKAGGMCVVQKHCRRARLTQEKSKDCRGWDATTLPRHPHALFLGFGDKDFPSAAAQVARQKPQPCLEKLPLHHCINQLIHQPHS
uniref:Uncharacterized protein n=1 Tax=Dromaius novaehollandiae TaxID=8790 RepID=A0A8C4JYM1_DRONO